jgi:hypothetical protein
MESYYEALMTKHTEVVVGRYWEMERYNVTDQLHSTKAEFFDYIKEQAFYSLLFFKFGDADTINEYVDEMWEEKKESSRKENFEIDEDVNLDDEPFTNGCWDVEYHIRQVLQSQQHYEETDFTEKLGVSIREHKGTIKNKKQHYLTQLKAHPLYDLIVFKCEGNLKAIHDEINRYWKG